MQRVPWRGVAWQQDVRKGRGGCLESKVPPASKLPSCRLSGQERTVSIELKQEKQVRIEMQ